jgi:hypothetical protein
LTERETKIKAIEAVLSASNKKNIKKYSYLVPFQRFVVLVETDEHARALTSPHTHKP